MIDSGDAQAAALAFEDHITSGKARALDSLLAQADAISPDAADAQS
jgi:hypothetical protein